MEIALRRACINDVEHIHSMQVESFRKLLDKYQDFATNPGAETAPNIMAKMIQEKTRYYIASLNDEPAGVVRVVLLETEKKCRVSPIFVLPQHQNKGVAQAIFKSIEDLHRPENGWTLSTIEQELGNCYLYEKIGYRKTGAREEIKRGMTIVHFEKKILAR